MQRGEITTRKPKKGHKFIYRYFDEEGSYIGQTKKSLKERAGKEGKNYLRDNNKWSQAILEKGFSHFDVEILCECLEEDADEREKFFIERFNSRTEGYNSTYGGKCYNPDWKYAGKKYHWKNIEIPKLCYSNGEDRKSEIFSILNNLPSATVSFKNGINYYQIPVTQLGMDDEGASTFNAIYKYLYDSQEGWHKIVRTPSGGISTSWNNFWIPMWDIRATGNRLEMTIVHAKAWRIQIYGRQALTEFRKMLLDEYRVDLDEFVAYN